MSERAAPETPADHSIRRPAPDRVWTEKDVAAYLQCAKRTVQDLRRDDETFPEPRYVRSMPRWLPADVQTWFEDLGQVTPGTSVAYQRASEQRSVAPKAAVPKAVVPKATPRRETKKVRRGPAR